MSVPPIPDDVRRFVLLAIDSVPYLEALLLMHSAPDHGWDATTLAQRLYLTEKVGAALLVDLHAAGLTAIDTDNASRFRYHPQSQELATLIERLATIYAKNLVGITNLIHSKTGRRAQRFVDAFVLRKES